MSAANYFMLTSLAEFCCNFLNPGNCLGIRAIAVKFGYDNLLIKAEKVLDEEFLPVSLAEEFLSFSPDYLYEILMTDNLEVKSEDHILESLLGWVNFDDRNRRNYFESLITAVGIQFAFPQILEQVRNAYQSGFVETLFEEARQARLAR